MTGYIQKLKLGAANASLKLTFKPLKSLTTEITWSSFARGRGDEGSGYGKKEVGIFLDTKYPTVVLTLETAFDLTTGLDSVDTTKLDPRKLRPLSTFSWLNTDVVKTALGRLLLKPRQREKLVRTLKYTHAHILWGCWGWKKSVSIKAQSYP